MIREGINMDDRLLKTHLRALYAHARWEREAVGILRSAVKSLTETALQGNPDCEACSSILSALDRAPFDQKTEKVVQAIDETVQSLG
jgi:transcription initiation factor IIE alpha subunit